MQKLKFKRIGFLIGFTLLVSIAVQAWRNYTQFKVIQDQLVNEIQQSLDNAVENYFAEIVKTDVVTVTGNRPGKSSGRDSMKISTVVTRMRGDSSRSRSRVIVRNGHTPAEITLDTLVWETTSSDTAVNNVRMDSVKFFEFGQRADLNAFFGKMAPDSIDQLHFFTNRLLISITRDSLDFDKINALLFSELKRKGIDINYRLVHRSGRDAEDSLLEVGKRPLPFKAISRSTFLPTGQSLEMHFENTALTILRRSSVEILTSLLFLGIIAFAFYYLYQTIKNQKEIAEIKQDLIANITHEFKTPIATTLSAIEGIENFNPENDAAKTMRYLGISKSQMHKLNQMVEKLLETATLDTDQLILKKEPIESEALLRQLAMKFQTLAPEKKIELILPSHCKTIEADPFHFENVLSNLLDNAVKYGGNEIRICLDQNGLNKIRVHDDGGSISPEQKERVFEQFYRIPKGDLHDVKGFGIGLYYVKKILEKHGGKIELETGKKSTTFITYWP